MGRSLRRGEGGSGMLRARGNGRKPDVAGMVPE